MSFNIEVFKGNEFTSMNEWIGRKGLHGLGLKHGQRIESHCPLFCPLTIKFGTWVRHVKTLLVP